MKANLIESVILMPSNIFTNMNGPSVVMVLNRAQASEDAILLVNASGEFVKGRPKNELTDANIDRIALAVLEGREVDGFSKMVPVSEIAKHDFNLSPSRYVSNGQSGEVMPLQEAVLLLKEAEEARGASDEHLRLVLSELGLT